MGRTPSPLTRENLLQNVANELSEADCRRTGRLSRDTVFARSSSRFFLACCWLAERIGFYSGVFPVHFLYLLSAQKKKEMSNEEF